MGKRAECKAGDHTYGAPLNVGGGILRSACQRCGAVQLELHDLDGASEERLDGLFRMSRRHSLFSPLVEFAALHGEDLVADRVFEDARAQLRESLLARA